MDARHTQRDDSRPVQRMRRGVSACPQRTAILLSALPETILPEDMAGGMHQSPLETQAQGAMGSIYEALP